MMNTTIIDNAKKQEVMDTIIKCFKELMQYELRENVIVESPSKSQALELMGFVASEKYFHYKAYDVDQNTRYEIDICKQFLRGSRIASVKTIDGFEAKVKLSAEEWKSFVTILTGCAMVFSTKLRIKTDIQKLTMGKMFMA